VGEAGLSEAVVARAVVDVPVRVIAPLRDQVRAQLLIPEAGYIVEGFGFSGNAECGEDVPRSCSYNYPRGVWSGTIYGRDTETHI
jgi:hypothetical protein